MLTHGNHTTYTMLSRQKERHPGKPFLIFEDEEITYEEMFIRVNRTAHFLTSNGIKQGETVAVMLSNSPVFYEIWFACGAIGAVLLPINTASTATELDYFLRHSESQGFIYEKELISTEHLETADRIGLRFVQAINQTWQTTRQLYPPAKIDRHVSPDDVACIMYTSGTTAKPKGVLLTHYNYMFAGHSSILYQQLNPQDRYLIMLPLFHANSQYYTSMAMLVCGGTIILEKRFSASRFWDIVDRHKPTVTSLVATVIKMLLELPEHPAEKRHTIRQAGYGLFVTTANLKEFQGRFGIKLFQWYGMTETTTTNITTPLYEEMPVDPDTGISAIGKAALGYEVKIVDPEGNELPPYEVGEIIMKGPSLMKGYFKNPEATAKTLKDGWLYTGDNAYYNEDGFFWFVDRNKDMIKRAGENISSIEVENILSDHPAVQDCAVVGEPDPLREEAVIAYVQAHEGVTVSESELRVHCEKYLSSFKIPEEFRLIENFPRTSIGKIQKNLLRNLKSADNTAISK